MCGRCTRSAAGTSSQREIASANSTKTSLDRADASSLPLFFFSGLLGHVVLQTAAGLQHRHPSNASGWPEERPNYSFYLKKRNVSYPCQCQSMRIRYVTFPDISFFWFWDSSLTACCLLLHITPSHLHNFFLSF